LALANTGNLARSISSSIGLCETFPSFPARDTYIRGVSSGG
jgi:hypothetical protein